MLKVNVLIVVEIASKESKSKKSKTLQQYLIIKGNINQIAMELLMLCRSTKDEIENEDAIAKLEEKHDTAVKSCESFIALNKLNIHKSQKEYTATDITLDLEYCDTVQFKIGREIADLNGQIYRASQKMKNGL